MLAPDSHSPGLASAGQAWLPLCGTCQEARAANDLFLQGKRSHLELEASALKPEQLKISITDPWAAGSTGQLYWKEAAERAGSGE